MDLSGFRERDPAHSNLFRYVCSYLRAFRYLPADLPVRIQTHEHGIPASSPVPLYHTTIRSSRVVRGGGYETKNHSHGVSEQSRGFTDGRPHKPFFLYSRRHPVSNSYFGPACVSCTSASPTSLRIWRLCFSHSEKMTVSNPDIDQTGRRKSFWKSGVCSRS